MDGQENKRFCAKCGAELKADACFCSICGAPVDAQPEGSVNTELLHADAQGAQGRVAVKESGIATGKLLVIVGTALAAIFVLIAIFTGGGNLDRRIIGKWSNESGAVIQFTRVGGYIGNPGTDHEERGAYRTEDGVIYVKLDDDDEEVGMRYRMDDKDSMEIEREYWSGWNWSSKWVEFWRVK